MLRLSEMIDGLSTDLRQQEITALEMKRLNLRSLLADLGQKQRSLFEEKQQLLRLELPEYPCYVYACPLHLYRAFSNVLSNAYLIQVYRTILLKLEGTDSQATGSIQDTGIGIEESDIPHIFERFYRGKNAAHIHKDTGLGLAITQEIIEFHRGKIEVNSQVGQGTQFQITLPQAEKLQT